MADTKIEWTDKSWNPITGCSPVSPACDHCYARRMARRLAGRYGYPGDIQEWSPERGGCYVTRDASFDVTFHPDRLAEPLHWRKPQRVFVCSMGDLFHEALDIDWQWRVFAVAAMSMRHTFLILTKRPEGMQDFITDWDTPSKVARETARMGNERIFYWPLSNVWVGVTIERQDFMWRRDSLRLTPAAKRFVSHEPLLGPIEYSDGGLPDWCIVGCETGPGARPMQPEWAHDLYRQCQVAGVPFFFKKGTPGLSYDPDMVATRELPE